MSRLFFAAQLHKFNTRRRIAAAVVALALVGGGAVGIFAYLVSTGHGSASYASPQPIQQPQTIALNVAVITVDMQPQNPTSGNDSQWSFTDTQRFTIRISSDSQNPAVVTNLNLSWAINGVDQTNGPLAGSFTMTVGAGLPTTLVTPNHVDVPVTVTFNNLPSVDQSALVGQNPTFTFTAS